MIAACLLCETPFAVRTRPERSHPERFCSRTCFYVYRRVEMNKRTRQCEVCGISFIPTNRQISDGRGRFCSCQCSGDSKPALKHKYKGGGPRGAQHIRIAERALGHKLPNGAQVHHVDGDGRNNANANLVICQSLAYHKFLHMRTRIIRAGGDPDTQRLCGTCKQLRTFAEMGKGPLISRSCLRCARARSAARREMLKKAS